MNLFPPIFLTMLFMVPAISQISTASTGARNIQADAEGEAKINEVMGKASTAFKEGLLMLQDNRRSEARAKFDKSIEAFLMSSVNVNSSDKLKNCYNQLIETIYRMEFPSNQRPQIESLAKTCSWSIDAELVYNVIKLLPPDKSPMPINTGNKSVPGEISFTEQKFEPSPLDELAKLELDIDEQAKSPNPYNKNQDNKSRTENCKNILSPKVRGIHLGMTKAQIEKALGKQVILIRSVLSDIGETVGYVSKVPGTNELFLNFFDGKLYQIKVNYDNSIKWNGIDEFVEKVSEALNLPNTWTVSSSGERRLLFCENFTLNAIGYYSFSLEVESPRVRRLVIERYIKRANEKRRQEEKKKEGFKP